MHPKSAGFGLDALSTNLIREEKTMSTDPSKRHEAVRIRAVRNDESTAALRKIARACIAIARKQIEAEERQTRRKSDAPLTSDGKEVDHA